MGELYRLDFASGRAYIGISGVSAQRRLVQHRWCAKYGSQLLVHRAWRKYGEPTLSVLGSHENWDDLLAAEKFAIERQNTLHPAGYNLTTGGRQPAMTPEIAAKLSAAQKGRVLTLEHRAKLAAAKRGTTRTIEVRQRMSEAQRARRGAEGCTPNRKRYPGITDSFTALRRAP